MADALQQVLSHVGVALGGLRGLDSPDKAVAAFRRLGYDVTAGAFGGALSDLSAQADGLSGSIGRVSTASGEMAIAAAIAAAQGRLVATVSAIRALGNEVAANAGVPVPGIADLPRRLTDFAVLDYLERGFPDVAAVLHLVGLVELIDVPAAGTPAKRVNWDRLTTILTDPGRVMDDTYQWRTALDTDALLGRLLQVARTSGLPGGIFPQADSTRTALGNATAGLSELRFPLFETGDTPELYGQFGITFSPAEPSGSLLKGIAILPYLMGAAGFDFAVCDRGEVDFQSSADLTGIGVVIRPPGRADGILNLNGAFGATLAIRERSNRSAEHVIVGSAGGTKLAVEGLGGTWIIGNRNGALDVGVEGEVRALRLVIAGGEGDGFLQRMMSGRRVEATANAAVGYSLLRGFTFRGGGQLAVDISAHVELGPIEVQGLRLALAPSATDIGVELGALLKLSLGPVIAIVENIGLCVSVALHDGNLGPADLTVGFKAPTGLGLAIDAGPVKGGGYLSFDEAQGEYAGAIELTIADFLSLKAIGLITTRLPGGQPGFAMLVVITAEFNPGLQLGFGFTLIGVGGIVGLNRVVALDPLVAGVRTGAVNSILFPTNVIANAPRIISDLRAIFPPHDGTFLIGPMAKLGWGTPTLISASLGVIIEIPGNVVILGRLRLALPTEDAPLVVLQVSFVGALEFDKRRIWFFATLFESRILFIGLQGEMGLLMDFSDNPDFVLSVGGFHPRFRAPPLPFPTPARIGMSLINESFARVRAEAYFAVTSNSVQLGVSAEAFFGFSAFSVEGYLSFDALLQLSPVYLIVEISSGFSVKVFGTGVWGVHLRGSLEGPAPWRVRGSAEIEILFFSFDVDVDVTFGEERRDVLPPIAVLPRMREELSKLESWRATPPPAGRLLVTFREIGAGDLVLHPVGNLIVSQRFAPLNLSLQRIGAQRPSDVNRVSITMAPGPLTVKGPVREKFAAAQYRDMDDAAKLSAPAYEPLDSGVELGSSGDSWATGPSAKRTARYETVIVDTALAPARIRFFEFWSGIFSHFFAGSAIARSPLSLVSELRLQPFAEKIAIKPDQFTVAFQADNKRPAGIQVFASFAEAQAHLTVAVVADPGLVDVLHVIPMTESQDAA
jgi:hypothetical protein